MRRRPSRTADVRQVAGDVAQLEDLRRSISRPVHKVVYLVSADERTADAYETAYVRGVNNVIPVLGDHPQPPRRFVFVSSTRVFREMNGGWVDESSVVEARDFATRAVLAGERIARDAPCPSTVVRLAGIYGPGRTRELDRVRRRCAVYSWLAEALRVPPTAGRVRDASWEGREAVPPCLAVAHRVSSVNPSYREGYGALLKEGATT